MRLLTGATDGIGLALARRWLERGVPALLTGRRSLERAAAVDAELFDAARYVSADLADPDSPEVLHAALRERGVARLDVLVHDAGLGWYGDPADQGPASVRALLEVDLYAPLRLTHRLLPLLRAAGGRVVFVSSVAALLPSPHYAVYAAAKAAAEGFFRSLRAELDGEVEVQVVRPGAVKTGMHVKSGAEPAAIGWERFPEPEAIARRIDRLLDGPPVWRTLGAGNRALGTLGRNLPRVVERLQARRTPGGEA